VTGTTERVLWHMLDAQFIDTDPEVSVIAVVMESKGQKYAVVCTGAKGMMPDEFVPAIMAAGQTLNAVSGDIVSIADPSQADMFDTGSQRPN
jgi:hypothetical protein